MSDALRQIIHRTASMFAGAAAYYAYPLNGRGLDLGNFDYTYVEAPDKSPEDNDAVLYSARAAALAGADYVELPDVGATKSITVLALSATDTTVYATDDATQTNDATATITANDTWQEVTLTFASAISGKIRLGTDGASFFAGSLADARCYDASSVLLDQFYFNDTLDEAATGLDGLPCVGRNGNIGEYVNCAAVNQIGMPLEVAGVEGLDDAQWLDGDNDSILLDSTIALSGDFNISLGFLTVGTSNAQELVGDRTGTLNRFYISFGRARMQIDGVDSGAYEVLGNQLRDGILHSLLVSRVGSDVTITIDGISETRTVSSADFIITGFGRNPVQQITGILVDVDINNVAAYTGRGETPWQDTIGSNDGTPSGDFATVEQLQTTPPQVLGMDYNRYSSVDPNVQDPDGDIFVFTSLTNSTKDAFGSDLDHIRAADEFNADGSGYWTVLEDTSLDTCQSWSCEYYHTLGETPTILDLGTPTIDVAADALTSTGITAPTYYVDGVAGTALSAGWNKICVTTATPTDCGAIFSSVNARTVRAYNRALTAEEVATL